MSVLLIGTIAIMGIGNNRPVAITEVKYEMTQGINEMGYCRRLESALHDGNGPIIKRGNKIISRITNPDGERITETTTFCVEL